MCEGLFSCPSTAPGCRIVYIDNHEFNMKRRCGARPFQIVSGYAFDDEKQMLVVVLNRRSLRRPPSLWEVIERRREREKEGKHGYAEGKGNYN